jgi:hypothetical protein
MKYISIHLGTFLRKNTKYGAIFLMMVMFLAPLASAGIGGTISGVVYNSNSYTLGQATVELYNYVGADTPDTVSPIQSEWLAETQRTWDTVNPTTSQPSGIPPSSPIYSDTTATNTAPSGLASPSWTQNIDAWDSNKQPSGTASITSQVDDTLATNIAPVGSAFTSPQSSDTLPVNIAPAGITSSIAAQTDDSSATNTPPMGVAASISPQIQDSSATNSKPAGISDPKEQRSDSRVVFVQPPGSVPVSPNYADAGSTSVQPTGAPASQSGVWYVGLFVIEADDDGDTFVDDTIFWVLTDVAVSGVYDSMSLSYEDSSSYNDGILGDQFVDSGDDEEIGDGETVTLGTYDFVVNFAADPSAASPVVWITSAEWYEGTFNIDLDGDGTIGGGELANYALSDTDSNGMYDTMDISVDDTTYGEGLSLADGLATTDNDERVMAVGFPTTEIVLETHNFLIRLIENPHTQVSDAGIWSWEWYTGSMTLDWDGDGALDLNILQFCISDRNSNGVYDRVDLTESTAPTFQEGDLGDLTAWVNNDEASTETDPEGITIRLGMYFYNVSFNVAPAASNPDFWIRSYTWSEGEMELEGQTTNVGSSDQNSDGLFDRFYIDLSPWPGGDGDFGDANEGPYQASDTISDGNLLLDYVVNSIYGSPFSPPGYVAEIRPSGATVGLTPYWKVGLVELPYGSSNFYTLAMSDNDGDANADTVDIDLDGDKTFTGADVIDGDDGSDGTATAFSEGGDTYYIIRVDPWWNFVNIIRNPWGLIPIFDYHNNVFEDFWGWPGGDGNYTYGIIDESAVGWDYNNDFDTIDQFYAVCVDSDGDGTYDGVYIDHDQNSNLGDGLGFHPLPNFGPPAPMPGPNNYGLYTTGNSIDPFSPAWPGITLMNIAPDGSSFMLSGGGPPIVLSSTETVSRSFPPQSDRYSSTTDGGMDPASLQMATPNNNNANGVDTTLQPIGISWNGGMGSGSSSTGTQPTGTASISANGFDAGVTSTQPPGAPFSQSGLWYFGIFQLDTDGDGSADNIVNWVLTDQFFGPGVYDTVSLSYDWASFADGILWDGYVDEFDDEEFSFGPQTIVFDTYWYEVNNDMDPTTDNTDAWITSRNWYEGSFYIDANDDGDASDYIYYVLSDTDSNGVYETVDISCEDTIYGEGGALGNGIVDYWDSGDNLDDERITSTADVTLGDSLLFTITYDASPVADINDCRIQSKEWYDGSFTIDADDDGVADNPVYYVLSDINSDGLYDTLDMSVDDSTFEEGALGDGRVNDPNNDERIQLPAQDNFDGVNLGPPSWDTSIGNSGFIEWNEVSTGPFPAPLVNPVEPYHSGYDSFWCGAPNINDPAFWPPGSTPPGIGFAWDEELKLLSIDLTLASKASMSFQHYYNFADWGYDGGNVHISDGSPVGPWDLLIPDGGYDATLDDIASTGEEAYTGSNMEWTKARFDLTPYVGSTVWLRWRAVSSTDGWDDSDGFDGDGWFIDDVMIQADRYVTLGSSLEFICDFDITPNSDAQDLRIISNEWYDGTFTIDGNGNGFAFETVRYVLTDTDSDGVYDAMDLSIDDNWYGEGALSNTHVNWNFGGDDERITASDDLTLGNHYLFTVEFDGGPNVDTDDARITSKEWYQGWFTMDADGDGLAMETIYYVLTDTDSEGLYEAMDISMDANWGDGTLDDNIVDTSGSNDELITSASDLTLGDHYLFMVGFDTGPNSDPVDARIRNQEWYEGTFSIDGDDSGTVDETVNYVLSDTNSDGLYDTMDMSIDDTIYGEGDLNDVIVDWEFLGNDERVSILMHDPFDGLSIGSPWWFTSPGASGFIEWNLDTSQGEFSSGATSYWCGAPNVNDPAAWPPGSTPPGYGLSWDEELQLWFVDLASANDAQLTFQHYYDTEPDFDGGAVYAMQGGPWTLIYPEEDYDGYVVGLDDDGYHGDSGGWVTATFDLSPYTGGVVWLKWKFVEDDMWCDEDGGWDGHGWFIDDVTILTNRHITLGTSYEFTVEYDIAPHLDADDVRITSHEWYLGDFMVDADDEDDDGIPDDNLKYVLTDTDSDGLYDTMDLSINDDEYGEVGGGGLSDAIVDFDWDLGNLDDERIMDSTNITCGDSLLFNVEFDNNPNNADSDDARILSQEWYEGTFSIDLDGDGVVDPDSVNFALNDPNSYGSYLPFMELSTDDTTYGEGAISDKVTSTDNDEIIWLGGGELVTMGAYTYHLMSYDQLFDGLDVNDGVNYDERDARLAINHWFWGTALLEGDLCDAVVVDSDSDGVFDELYIDVNDNGNWGDSGIDVMGVSQWDTFQGSWLELQYTVTNIDPQGQYFEIEPTGASVGLTTSWFVGQIEVPESSGDWYDVVLSDIDDDSVYETVDFDLDLPGDSVVDATGITETSGLIPFDGTLYQVINIQDWGWNVRVISYIDATLGPLNDISLSDTFHYGIVSESDLTLNLNQDGDITDTFRTIVVDHVFWGIYQGVFIDTDSDDDLSSEPLMVSGSQFPLTAPAPHDDHEFDIDYIDPSGDYYAFKQINHPTDTYVTDSDGYYSLDAHIDGYYWIKVSSTQGSWGYGTAYDTNSGFGIEISNGDPVDNWNEYLPQTGNFVYGAVYDSITLDPVWGARVEIHDSTGELVVSTHTHSDGSYQLAVVPAPGYDIVYSHPGYHTDDGRTTGTWQDLGILADTFSIDALLVPDTVPPAITLDYPAEGQTVSGLETVSVTATDDFMLDSVEVSFDHGTTYHPMVTAGGNIYTYLWDTTAYSEGQYRVTVRATDTASLSDSEFVDVYVSNDATDPTVTIVSPTNNDYIEGTYIIQILALDNYGLETVYVEVGGVDYLTTYNAITGYYEHPLDTTTYGDGLNSLSATATDYNGNFAVDALVSGVNIDNTAPILWINSPTEGETVYGSGVTIDCASTDPGSYVPTVEFKIDSGSWTLLPGDEALGWVDMWDSMVHTNGVHTIYFRSSDEAGHITYDSVMVWVDNDDPVVSVITPSDSDYIQGTYTFRVAASDEIILTNVYATIDFTDYTLGYNEDSGYWEVTLDTTTLSEGVHTLTATAEDGIPSHTQTTVAISFDVDNLEPVLSINSPYNWETVFGSAVTLDVDCYDEGISVPTVEARIDSGAWITMTGSEVGGWTAPWDSTSVSNGEHTVTFRAYDTIGHYVYDSVTITVDNDNPLVSVVAPVVGELVHNTYTFKVAASDAHEITNVYITINAVDYPTGYNTASGFWEVVVDTTSITDGTYGITATAEDGIPGHTVTSTSYDFNIDNNAPSLSINYPTHGETIYGSLVAVDVNSVDPGVSDPTVQYRVDRGPWTTLSGSEIIGWAAIWDTTIHSDGDHTLWVRAYDSLGHVVMESIEVIVDNTSPLVSIVAPMVSEYIEGVYSFRISAIDAIGVTSVYITLDGNDYVAGYNTASGYWEVSLDTSLFTDGTYSITATAEDGIPSHTTTTAPFDFYVDNTVPSLTITLPVPGQHVRNNVIFNVLGSDTHLDRVEYSVDGTGWVPISTAWDTTMFGDGEHTITIRAVDHAGHITQETITVTIDNLDTDGDSIGDLADWDIDADGVDNEFDAFPRDILEWMDTDSDGIGDNADLDDDGDGVIDTEDDFPQNPLEWIDTDSDGIGDNADNDDDDDGVFDENDHFPLDPDETIDTDSDGIGDNTDTDDDGDGVSDTLDDFPHDPTEYMDTDSDGVGDLRDIDIDGDGYINLNDAFPFDPTESLDTDLDGVGDNLDLDDDGDNIPDLQDRFPHNFFEYLDTDGDLIGDNTDFDDDGDLVPDINDAFPLDPTETVDLDADGIGDNSDTDRDGDGFANSVDIFPDDKYEWADNDKDGVGDNADPDDDNDGVSDISDYAPMDKETQLPPFWWWWIPFAALICLLILVTFMGNKQKAKIPDEEKLIKKYEKMEEDIFDEPAVVKKQKAPSVPISNIPYVYTASELEGMKKSQLVEVARNLNLSTAGTKTDLTTRINLAQAEGTMEGIMKSFNDFDCPSCGKILKVESKATIPDVKCPHCGTHEKIK